MCFLKAIFQLPNLKFSVYGATSRLVYRFSTLSSVEDVLKRKPLSPGDLISAINFSVLQRSYVEKRISSLRSPDTPLNVLKLFQKLGFSESQMLGTISRHPTVLFTNAEKVLKPKLDYFQQLGIVGSDLGKFISGNPNLLTASLEKTLVPGVEILRKIINVNSSKHNFVAVLQKCGYVLPRTSNLISNIAFFEGCGIVGSRLLYLLNCQTRLFIAPESRVKDLFARARDLGFSTHSRMFVHAVLSLAGVSVVTFERKLKLFSSFGFTNPEIMQIIAAGPYLLKCSEDKLKFGLEFYLSTVQLEKSALIRFPPYLTYSFENRVIPRYNVLKMIESKKLMKRQPSFASMLSISEDKFLQKFIFAFQEHVDEMLVVYKGQRLKAIPEQQA